MGLLPDETWLPSKNSIHSGYPVMCCVLCKQPSLALIEERTSLPPIYESLHETSFLKWHQTVSGICNPAMTCWQSWNQTTGTKKIHQEPDPVSKTVFWGFCIPWPAVCEGVVTTRIQQNWIEPEALFSSSCAMVLKALNFCGTLFLSHSIFVLISDVTKW